MPKVKLFGAFGGNAEEAAKGLEAALERWQRAEEETLGRFIEILSASTTLAENSDDVCVEAILTITWRLAF